ncbi:MAG: HD domain-containing protein [Hyphomicrobiaceae bacterium]
MLARRGTGRYGLSAVTQLEHALQSAALAQRRGFEDALVIAALLHDVGHLLVGNDVDLARQGRGR